MVLLDIITGDRVSTLYGHTGGIQSIAFSLDGTLLVSRSKDDTLKLWDAQTGGLIRTYNDHTFLISAASISPEGTTVVLGTTSGSIHLWDVRTGACRPIICQDFPVVNVSFSPTNSRRLISSWNGAIQQWDLDGHQVSSHCEDYAVVGLAYAPDGTRFISCGGWGATVRDSESGLVMVKPRAVDVEPLSRCCFSPEGRFVACSDDTTVYVWDITIPGAPLVGRLAGHSDSIIFLAFSSSLISGSSDKSMKFWQTSSFLAESTTDQVTLRPLGGQLPISSVKLFAKDKSLVTSDRFGKVRIWDITTGTCKSTSSTPAKGPRDTHLEGHTLIIVWGTNLNSYRHEYHVWDVHNHQLLRRITQFDSDIRDLRISGDGSKIFGFGDSHIEAVSMQAEDVRRVGLGGREVSNFFVHGSKVGISHSHGMGWDFGGSKVPEFGEFQDRPRLDLFDCSRGSAPRWIEDTATQRPVFRFPERYTKTGMKVEWDSRYLIIWSESGELVIMDFDPVRRALDGTR